ncbi:hypothetical protein PM082_001556 [Marasmius tenuissimus]|nr:hypothetical protein PM082_001556 [Marasmius tenuissimus]
MTGGLGQWDAMNKMLLPYGQWGEIHASQDRCAKQDPNNWSKLCQPLFETKISSKAQRNAFGDNNPTAEPPVEGGPKTAEVHIDEVAKGQLLKEVQISEQLNMDQRIRLEQLVWDNQEVFGLDGRLGNHPGLIDIPMKEGFKPVLLPAFPASPANREVMDKQINSWLQLGVIEPSRSLWGAPVIIVYRNAKH